MKWRIPDNTPPKEGDVRLTRRFAWKPTQIGRVYVWLERYEVEERYFANQNGFHYWAEVDRRPLVWMY